MQRLLLLLLVPLFLCSCTVSDKRNDNSSSFTTSEIEGGVSITQYRGSDKIVYIPDTIKGKKVVEISDNVFVGKRFLTKIVVCGNGIKKIGTGAFASNKKLESIEGLNNLESIGEYAFAECDALTEISLGGNITRIEKGTFTGCESLERVVLPTSVKQIGKSAFEGCKNLTFVTGTENVEIIEEYAFASCMKLSDISAKKAVCQYDSFKNAPAAAGFNVPIRPQNLTFDGTEMTPVFTDDFDGDDIDLTKWSKCPEWQRQLGYWEDDNSFTDKNGNLILLVDVTQDGTMRSGAIRTAGKFSQERGRFEARCKLGEIQGFWGAFWLMPVNGSSMASDNNNQSSVDGCEVDIFESPYLTTNSVNYAIHWDGYGSNHKSTSNAPSVPNLYYGYHTFTLDWTESEYIFYIDGVEYWRTSAAGIQIGESYMKLTVEIGAWGGTLDTRLCPTNALTVDYVKTWQ